MTKQGGSYKSWKKRWFILKGSQLFYFKTKKARLVVVLPSSSGSALRLRGGFTPPLHARRLPSFVLDSFALSRPLCLPLTLSFSFL